MSYTIVKFVAHNNQISKTLLRNTFAICQINDLCSKSKILNNCPNKGKSKIKRIWRIPIQ